MTAPFRPHLLLWPLCCAAALSCASPADPGAPVGDAGVAGDVDASGEDEDDFVVGPNNGNSDGDLVCTARSWFPDADRDGHGDANAEGVSACEPPEGHVTDDSDCDDTDSDVNPNADEVPGDGVDQNCDGVEMCYMDQDGDGYRPSDQTVSAAPGCTDAGLADAPTLPGDCDDMDDAAYPEAPEACDSVDNDCDSEVDEGMTNACGTCGPTPTEVCDEVDNDCDGETDEGSACPCPSTFTEDSAYLFCNLRTTWGQARQLCDQAGFSLVQLDDRTENDDVAAEAANRGWNNIWIGLNDREEEDTYVWDGGEEARWTRWDSGEPNDDGSEDCVKMDTGNGRWTDTECGSDTRYVCELEL